MVIRAILCHSFHNSDVAVSFLMDNFARGSDGFPAGGGQNRRCARTAGT
jgi:hypothetical protein